MTFNADSFRLDARLVLVTGAARGLGAAIARGCAAMGARLALCDRDADGLAAVATSSSLEGPR